MTHVVTDACIKCKYTDCVDVCPVDCFKEGPDFLVIDLSTATRKYRNMKARLRTHGGVATLAKAHSLRCGLRLALGTNPSLSFVPLLPGCSTSECIDCAVCIPECPVNAIYADTDTPEQFKPFLELNERLARLWPTLSKRTAPLPTAEQWKDKTGKLASVNLDR